MEGVMLEEGKVESIHWAVAEDGDTAQNYHNQSDQLIQYLRDKAEQRDKLYQWACPIDLSFNT